MPFLTERQRRTLTHVAETLIPSLPAHNGDNPDLFSLSASDLDLPLEEALEAVTDSHAQADLGRFLSLLELAPVNLAVAGVWGAFSAGGLERRTRILQGWATSRLPIARKAFQGVKRMTVFLFYSFLPEGEDATNPTFAAVGFPGPPGPQTDAEPRITPTEVTGPTTLEADILVIGSGAGGGVVAGELAAAGFDVIVMDKGGYQPERDFTGRELEGNQALFENAGALTTADLSMAVLAGSTLGGGTVVNWNTSLRPPDYVREEWAREYGFTAAATSDYTASIEAVERRINVTTAESHPNAQNAILERGCVALGHEVEVIRRNVSGCEDCGFCHFGCPFGAKQSTLVTYLQDAYERGARMVVNAHVDRVCIEEGRAVGAVATVGAHTVEVRAKIVVVAAGSIHTPALLQRSGLRNPHIGQNLKLHPVVPTFGLYDDPVRTWVGPPQTRLMDAFADLDGQGHGFRMEVSPGWPGLFALALPWESGRGHKRIMQNLAHVASNIMLVRDKHGGSIKRRADGSPEIHYALHPYDAKHLMRGLIEGLKVHEAAGARAIYAPFSRWLAWERGKGDFGAFLRAAEEQGLQPNAYAMFSAHQMASARIAADPARGAVRPSGETHEVRGLFVADGSVLPTASGVNPMISIMGTAHHIAQHIKEAAGA